MNSKRRRDGDAELDSDPKRKKTISEQPDSDNALPGFSYGDDEEDDEAAKRLTINGKIGSHEQEVEDEDEDDRSSEQDLALVKRAVEIRRDCPYLDTVNRQVYYCLRSLDASLCCVLYLFVIFSVQVLDFDFEKFCSVSLSNLNVYACLVCGKYYQGRGKKSHAYTHSLEAGHHVYINLRTEKVYCLPDGYEISDPSLEDIRHVLNPRLVFFFYCYCCSH